MEPIIFDAHCDTASELLNRNQPLYDNTLQFNLRQAKQFSGYIQVFAAWIDTEQYPDGFARAKQIISHFKEELERNSEFISYTDGYSAICDTLAKGKIAAMLSVEDGAALSGNLDNLYQLYNMGVRLMTLTWNGRNELADGIMVPDGGGLTDFGRKVVDAMNELHMAIDVSHLSERGFYEVLERSSEPVCCTHSDARAVCSHPRNLSDDQFRALAGQKGVSGINLYDEFIRDGGNASIDDVLKHIDHFLSLGGENHIGIGADFDGIDKAVFQIENVSQLSNLLQAMRKSGADPDIIEKITHKNFLNYLKFFDKK